MSVVTEPIIRLARAGVALIIDTTGPVPVILHWGRDLGPLDDAALAQIAATAAPAVLNSSIDSVRVFSLLPGELEGWQGRPAIAGHSEGTLTTLRWRTTSVTEQHADEADTFLVDLLEHSGSLRITVELRLDAAGVLRHRMCLARVNGGCFDLSQLMAMLPVPARATHVLDFTGKWCRERSPQWNPIEFGARTRDVRRGKPGHDSPFLMALGTADLGFRRGEVWGVHVGWSGDQTYHAERLPEGAGALAYALGGGELLRPGEIRLTPGAEYRTPDVYYSWSDHGLDGLAERFHDHLRARPNHPHSPRPLVLNTWEAVYFDHDPQRLLELARIAARVGVERLVLDDGWFRGRRSDTAGLGDWYVDEHAWPGGLAPLAAEVHDLGMEFGLWVEPEMVNLDSDLARTHPDWLLAPSAGVGPSARNQYVLNVAHPEAWAYLLERLSALVTEYHIDYLKWDHNRDLLEAVVRDPRGDRPGSHAQTTAVYRLMDALRAQHRRLEIEACAAGGGRIDFGMLERTVRVWPSDCNDPVERQAIQRWTGQLLPPELVGAHVGDRQAHTTHRTTSESFRLITALFGHAGIEWDLAQCSPDQLDRLRRWADHYRRLRPLLHSGRVVRADLPDPATYLHGVVARDRAQAVFCWARLVSSPAGQAGRVCLPGIDPSLQYRVNVVAEFDDQPRHSTLDPAWVVQARTGIRLDGRVLAECGLPMPTLDPEQAILIELDAR